MVAVVTYMRMYACDIHDDNDQLSCGVWRSGADEGGHVHITLRQPAIWSTAWEC